MTGFEASLHPQITHRKPSPISTRRLRFITTAGFQRSFFRASDRSSVRTRPSDPPPGWRVPRPGNGCASDGVEADPLASSLALARYDWSPTGSSIAPLKRTGRHRALVPEAAAASLRETSAPARMRWRSTLTAQPMRSLPIRPGRARCCTNWSPTSRASRRHGYCWTRTGSKPARRLLDERGQLGFHCPGTWTRNVYGGAVREAFTSLGQLQTIIDFSDAESFETSADAYPHFGASWPAPPARSPQSSLWVAGLTGR